MPGWTVGETRDARGTRGFVNTLQTREQHIRREKATSNICTNEALAAITAATYLALMGPTGLRAAARVGVAKAHALAGRLAAIPGCAIALDGPFFDRFQLRTPVAGRDLRHALAKDNVLVDDGLHHEERDGIVIQCTEMTSESDADALVSAVERITAGAPQAAVARVPPFPPPAVPRPASRTPPPRSRRPSLQISPTGRGGGTPLGG